MKRKVNRRRREEDLKTLAFTTRPKRSHVTQCEQLLHQSSRSWLHKMVITATAAFGHMKTALVDGSGE